MCLGSVSDFSFEDLRLNPDYRSFGNRDLSVFWRSSPGFLFPEMERGLSDSRTSSLDVPLG